MAVASAPVPWGCLLGSVPLPGWNSERLSFQFGAQDKSHPGAAQGNTRRRGGERAAALGLGLRDQKEGGGEALPCVPGLSLELGDSEVSWAPAQC